MHFSDPKPLIETTPLTLDPSTADSVKPYLQSKPLNSECPRALVLNLKAYARENLQIC